MIDSLINNDIIDYSININKTEELNEEADKAEKSEDATAIIKQYEDIICTKKKKLYPLYPIVSIM